MSFSSNGTSSALKIGVEDIVVDSRPTGCLCNLRILFFIFLKRSLFMRLRGLIRKESKITSKVDELMKVVMLYVQEERGVCRSFSSALCGCWCLMEYYLRSCWAVLGYA